MYTIAHAVYKYCRNLIAPPFCEWCKKWLEEPSIFCIECSNLIKPLVSTKILVTPTISMPVFAVSPYQELLKSLILAKIYSQRLASKQLGMLMWDLTTIRTLPFDYIVPIPLHWSRYAYRGYNQAEVIASIIAQKSGKPLVHLLRRNRRTVFQSKINVEHRFDNLYNAFDLANIDKERYKDKHLLLVDDLMTTGATLKNAAKKLLLLKPKNISYVKYWK